MNKEYQQRVIDEKAALDEKIAKLNAFLVSDSFYKLLMHEQELLKTQSIHMQHYSDVLASRILLFNSL